MTREGEGRVRSARDRAKQETGSFTRTAIRVPEGMKMFQLKAAGSIKIDIIPFWAGAHNTYWQEGEMAYDQTWHTHGNIGAENNAYSCLKNEDETGRCPICDIKAQYRQRADFDKALDKQLMRKKRQLYYVVDHANREAGVQLWDISYHLFGKTLKDKLDNAEESDGVDFFFLPHKGLCLKCVVKEKSMPKRKPFFEVTSIDFKQREQQYDKGLPATLTPLDELVIKLSHDKLKAKFLQTDDAEAADAERAAAGDPDEVAPVRRPPPPDDDDMPRRVAPKPAPDDDDVPPPKPKAKPPVDDDDVPPPKPKAKPPVDDDDVPPPKPKPKAEVLPKDVPLQDRVATNGIKVGMRVFHDEHGKCEVTHVSGDGTSLRLKDKAGEEHRAITPEDCEVMVAKAAPVEEAPAPAPKPKPKPPVDDDDVPAPKPKAAKAEAGWDDDDLPPPPRKKTPPPTDD